jgi:hypothetical protein
MQKGNESPLRRKITSLTRQQTKECTKSDSIERLVGLNVADRGNKVKRSHITLGAGSRDLKSRLCYARYKREISDPALALKRAGEDFPMKRYLATISCEGEEKFG